LKRTGAAIERFIAKPDPKICIVLLYGPDYGLVQERANALEAVHLGEQAGPFSQTLISQTELKADPAGLSDQFCALALGGGPRVVRLKTTADQAAKPVSALLAALERSEIKPAALLLIEAGDLGPRSALRKAVEQDADNAVALPCYAPNARDIESLAQDEARQQGLTIDPNALALLLNRLPQDRAIARSELNKLVLYCIEAENQTITFEHVAAIITDATDQRLDDFALAVAEGAFEDADRIMANTLVAGQSPIALLRALQRHFFRLLEAGVAVREGKDTKSAMASLRPPVFFAIQSRFSHQMNAWHPARLRNVAELCLETERAMKRSGAVPANLLARLAVKICHGAPVKP
jgi:DNA polymerase III subunit delta